MTRQPATATRAAGSVCRLVAGLFLLVASVVAPAAAYAQNRVALVIGNAAYKHTPVLRNPANDARAIAELFRQIGFDDVQLRLDLDFEGMRLALRDFGQKTHGASVAVVYFAGHGLELGGENYLVPVDAALKSASSVAFEAATLSAVLDAIRPASRLRLVILDACRNNPLAARMQVAGGLTRSVPRGLGRIEPTGDVLVAYAAKAGTVAADGKGRHSPYAQALLSTLATPGLDIRLVMGRVRDLVIAGTGGAQEPFVYGSLGGANVALVPAKPADTAARDYELAAKVGTEAAWDAFLAAHPAGFHAELARAQRAKVAALPAPKPELSPAEVEGSKDLAEAVQRKLQRVGCYDGAIDGIWGPASRSALASFNRHAKTALPTDGPQDASLAVLRKAAARICPDEGPGPSRTERGGSNSKCFTFQGRQFCE